ncbi:MAG: YhcH/YjgK/YiaL family protein [Sulfuricella sp.]|jgi:YhcH/YjgK/YiaL family protein|nr:YhcH/YjgK/YiaL family protein [Sulfuricella sp.]
MILDTLANAARYAPLHALFPRAFEFLRSPGLKALAPGRHPIEDERLFAIVEIAAGRNRDQAKLECHRRYIDIQFVVEGTDEMGWKASCDCREPLADYLAEKDIQFFRDTPASWIATPPGAFCIFFPQDAHAPLVSNSQIHKVILKIAVA